MVEGERGPKRIRGIKYLPIKDPQPINDKHGTMRRPGNHQNEYPLQNKEDYTMEIIRKTEGLTSADLYSLTKGNDVRRMADAKGEVLDILKFVLYKDEDVHGDPMTVLALETVDGAKYATNSRTFTRNFVDILAIFDAGNEPLPTRFKVGSGKSKSNREYLTCDIAQ